METNNDNTYTIKAYCSNCGNGSFQWTTSGNGMEIKIEKGITVKDKLERTRCERCGCKTLVQK
jgi:ribosomal protein S27AE